MTDANLMDANCKHGGAWYDCAACDLEMREQLEDEEHISMIDDINYCAKLDTNQKE